MTWTLFVDQGLTMIVSDRALAILLTLNKATIIDGQARRAMIRPGVGRDDTIVKRIIEGHGAHDR